MAEFVVERYNSLSQTWTRSGNVGLRRSFTSEPDALHALDTHRSPDVNYRIVPVTEEGIVQEETAIPAKVEALGVSLTTEPVPEPNAQFVRTTVKYDEDSIPQITCTHPVPDVSFVLAQLSAEYKKKAKKRPYETLQRHIIIYATEIPLQAWADAISAAVMYQLANEADATSELHHVTQGGYLALGNTLYRMSAVAQLPQMKALATTRKKLREAALQEAASVLDAAKVSANGLLANALKMRADAQYLKQQVETEVARIPPSWLVKAGFPIRYKEGQWQTLVYIKFVISSFDLAWSTEKGEPRKYSWLADPMPPRPIALWIPFDSDGSYSATTIRVDSAFPRLPHISHSGGCMELSGSAPKKITDRYSLEDLQYALQNCHARVQLDSLFTDVQTLMGSFPEAFPKQLKDAFSDRSKSYTDRLLNLRKSIEPKVPEMNSPTEASLEWQA